MAEALVVEILQSSGNFTQNGSLNTKTLRGCFSFVLEIYFAYIYKNLPNILLTICLSKNVIVRSIMHITHIA